MEKKKDKESGSLRGSLPAPSMPRKAEGVCLNLMEEKISFPGAIRAEATLQLLRGRGGENPARRPVCGTGWGPALESLRVVSTRPAKGEEIFSQEFLKAGVFQ